MTCRPVGRLFGALLVFFGLATATSALAEVQSGTYRGTLRVVRFDVSPPLRDIPPLPVSRDPAMIGGMIIDPPGTEGKPPLGRQTPDQAVQQNAPSQEIPAPIVSFDALNNISGIAPPDPVGDIGPNHYLAMSNYSFAVYNRSGSLVFGPAANNSLWAGLGGPCQNRNDGDPIVLYDQFADRWLLTQFTAGSAPFFNCVALSQTSDPMGPWYRWQIANGSDFPDYPKYGVGSDAYFISTRDFQGSTGGPYIGLGAFALNRAQMIAGDPDPIIVSFFVERSVPENAGDGILPMDIDGSTLPPADSPHYFIGTMDDGGPYAADQDAITVWEFDVDFEIPADSTFTLVHTVPIASYDTMFPCGPTDRNCIPQPNTANKVDHQGYRQRPLHRAAYRNFGTYEALVANQSVEAAPEMSGIRWWEIRNPGSSPVIYQQGTYAPGVEDGIHRWFGSVAMDSAGNVALGYSASSESVFPGIRYSGRLFTDLPGTMGQGEGVIVNGTGSQTGSQRWGDYSSMNVDPTDDCTFWYVNQYIPATSFNGWRLRVGAFRFDECGEETFAISNYSESALAICQGDTAEYGFNLGSVEGFSDPVTLSVMGNPGTAGFNPNPVTPPNLSMLTIDNTVGAAAGDYPMTVTGSDGVTERTVDIDLTVYDAAPAATMLISPPSGSNGVSLNPTFEWTGLQDAQEYVIEVATDQAFTNLVWSESTEDDEATPDVQLDNGMTYYWRVRAANACGPGANSTVFSLTTMALPGQCADNQIETVVHHFDFESGAQGWTHSAAVGPDTWILSGENPNGGAQHWHGDDVNQQSDQQLSSPVLAIPISLSSLTFRFANYQHFENDTVNPPNCWDGGILEVSTDGGKAFTQVPNENLLTDPYDGTINLSGIDPNPLAGLLGWCGAPQPYTDSRVDIADLAGENDVQFRFRIGTDGNNSAPGWDIDDVMIVGCLTMLEFEDGFEGGDD